MVQILTLRDVDENSIYRTSKGVTYKKHNPFWQVQVVGTSGKWSRTKELEWIDPLEKVVLADEVERPFFPTSDQWLNHLSGKKRAVFNFLLHFVSKTRALLWFGYFRPHYT